jgi:hypothetical protein
VINLSRPLQIARGVTGHGITVHADLADINTLAELLGIIRFVSLGNADTLLLGVLRLLRTRCKPDCYCE